MLKKITAILALAALLAYSAVNYPYPQRKNYGNSTINAVNSSADNDLKAKFQNYIRDFYVEQGSQARIKFYDPDKESDANFTVSEGIGYAMIMAVYFSDVTTSYQSHFDKLWAYYKANVNSRGFMNWKIQGFGTVNQSNGATDAELDVALALIMARYQFGNTQYETDANDLIGKILQYEVSSGGLLKPGDDWDADRNPSYVAPAAFELFKANSSNWSNVLSTNYTFLKANRNSSTGLPSDWADNNGNPKQCSFCGYNGTNYGQDAVRAPWRWATANAWFGHADAKDLLNKLGTWVNGKNPTDVKGPISLDGTFGNVANSSYVGSLMCALTNNSSYQSKLNSFFSTMMGQTDKANGSYFNQSMQILTGLLVSGNMPNLKACASSAGCGTNMPAVGGSTGGTLLDRLASAGTDGEDDRSLSALWESWFAYTDKDADGGKGGSSKITNVSFKAKDENDNCKEIDSYRVVLQGTGSDTDWAVRILSYTLDKGSYKYAPFVALGLDARKNGKSASEGGYTLSSCTNGFSYSYKGSAHRFKVLSSEIPEGSGADHFKNITSASTDWTTVAIPPDELAQPTWVETADKKAFSLAKVRGWAWELEGAATSGGTALSATTGSFAIKDFKCLGTMTLPSKPTFKCRTNSGGGSSSSVSGGGSSSSSVSGGNSSSSSSNASGGGSSSSVSGGNSSSSSSRGNSSSSVSSTPIISLSQLVTSNGAFAIKNGVNLQVSKTASVEVFGLNGKSVRKHEFSNGSYSLMLGDLPKGLYIVKVQFGSQRDILRVPVR